MSLEDIKNGAEMDAIDESESVIHIAPLDATEGGSDALRKNERLERRRAAALEFFSTEVSGAVEHFLVNYVRMNHGIVVMPEDIPENTITRRELIIVRATRDRALRTIAQNSVVTVQTQPGQPVRTTVSLDEFKRDIVRMIAEELVNIQMNLAEHEVLHFDLQMIAETTDVLMYRIVEHPQMSPKELVQQFFRH